MWGITPMHISAQKISAGCQLSTKSICSRNDAVTIASSKTTVNINRSEVSASGNNDSSKEQNTVAGFDVSWQSMSDLIEIRSKMKESLNMKHIGTFVVSDSRGIISETSFYKPEIIKQPVVEINRLTNYRSGSYMA